VQDLPCGGLRLRLIVGLRRVQCRNPASARRTFSVAPPLVNRCQRHITRIQTVLWHGCLALGGTEGVRLVNHLGTPANMIGASQPAVIHLAAMQTESTDHRVTQYSCHIIPND
jgi:hypothetical protein